MVFSTSSPSSVREASLGSVSQREASCVPIYSHFRGREDSDFLNVKHEARLTGSAGSMQDTGWNCGESFELGAGQPLLSMRLFCVGFVLRV